MITMREACTVLGFAPWDGPEPESCPGEELIYVESDPNDIQDAMDDLMVRNYHE